MADPQLVAEISQMVRAVAKIAPNVLVDPDARLVEDLGIDSLDLVRISMMMEDRFGLVIDPDEVTGFLHVNDLARHVARLRSSASAA